MSAMSHIGLVVNPLAGLGGSLALKGSDGKLLATETNEPQLDRQMCGLHKITSGYDDHVLYRVSTIQGVGYGYSEFQRELCNVRR